MISLFLLDEVGLDNVKLKYASAVPISGYIGLCSTTVHRIAQYAAICMGLGPLATLQQVRRKTSRVDTRAGTCTWTDL